MLESRSLPLLRAGMPTCLPRSKLQLQRSTGEMRILKSKRGKLRPRDKPRGPALCRLRAKRVVMKINPSLLA